MKNVEEKSILIPVSEDYKMPSLEKIISIAKTVNLKVHIAGFISPAEDADSMIRQTIKLTCLIKKISSELKKKSANISSKIYVNRVKSKLNQVIAKEKVILIAISGLSGGIINLRRLSKDVMILQLSPSDRNEKCHDILLMHKIKRENIKAISQISRLFGDRLFLMQRLNNQAVEDLSKSFGSPKPSGLDRQAKPDEINEWLLKHRAGLIALNKTEVNRSTKKVIEVLKNGKTPVLIY